MDITSMIMTRGGYMMPVMGLGTWKLTNHTAEVVAKALQHGYKMVDTSGDYGTQPGVDMGIKMSGVDREDTYVVTKVEEHDNAYDAVIKNLDELDLAYADLILVHRPPESGAGEDLWRGLIRARNEGLANDIGVSNYSIEEIQELIGTTGEVPAVNQIEWTPFGHSSEMLGYCQENGIIIQAYSPLTRGERIDDGKLDAIADHYGKTPAQVMIRWSLQLGTVPLPKANHVVHLRENLDVFDFELSGDDMRQLNSLNREYSALGSLPYV